MTIDEMIAVLQAYKEGKKIQVRNARGIWEDANKPEWDFGITEYRVKPEPHYRPFKSSEEVMEAIKEHGDWIKWKHDPGFNIIECVAYSVIWLGTAVGSICFKEAFENITFIDGTPFGVKED